MAAETALSGYEPYFKGMKLYQSYALGYWGCPCRATTFVVTFATHGNVQIMVAIIMEGSRGDVQPYLVAALALKEAGYSVLVLGPTDCAPFAAQFGLDYFDHYTINTKAVVTSPSFVEAYTTNNFFKLTKSMTECKDKHREDFVGRMITVLKNFQPDLIIGCYLVICDCLTMGLALQKPVLFLGLQVMIASNYLAPFGMFPKLPAFMNMNYRLWYWLCEHFAEELNRCAL
ncbi:unnamed protein product [Symbiodinium natans]|uniref:Glycosyltransferase family 28 N-terminal domain-containing protein n=1 Tax=Symbiodinium natans TaxID=878477 RepID=A0A812Q1U0_9DINO|nr:unnamed protein product [Symbiodinium natans]